MTTEPCTTAPRDLAIKVRKVFLIFPSKDFLEPLVPYSERESPSAKCVASAIEGLHSVITAAGLPFQLIQDSTLRRRFDRFHASARILALLPEKQGGLTEEDERRAYKSADEKMTDFLETIEGQDFVRDQLLYEMDDRMRSADVRVATQELLVQTLISTWSIFESFARSFFIEWLNDDPSRASGILTSPDLKDLFGKKTVDIQTIGDHSFDLTKSMGTILFKERRLDSLANIRAAMKALLDSGKVQESLGKDLWVLNQRRHLFVHNRGIVDSAYLTQTGDAVPLGDRLALDCDDVELHLKTVRGAIIAIGDAVAEIEGSKLTCASLNK